MKPFVKLECAINNLRQKGRLARLGHQIKDKKVIQISRVPKVATLRSLHERLAANSLVEIIRGPDGQQMKILQKHPASLSKGSRPSHPYNVGVVVRNITTKTAHNEQEMMLQQTCRKLLLWVMQHEKFPVLMQHWRTGKRIIIPR